jgi:two-component system CheB/CheR fusion protein
MPNKSELTDFSRQILLDCYAPVSVVTDRKGDILYIHGDTAKFLRPAPGQFSASLVDMARKEIQSELRTALRLAAEGQQIADQILPIGGKNDALSVRLSVRMIADPGRDDPLLLVSFQEMPAMAVSKKATRGRSAGTASERIAALEQELAVTRQTLQASIDELQAASEDLKSTNEEIQSTNEELQSTNEELETSKEEAQSVNEELITINNELHSKIEQLNTIQNDMKNLIENINIATVFLDKNLAIRNFTNEFSKIYRVQKGDIGRKLADFTSYLVDDDLIPLAETVLRSQQNLEIEVKLKRGGISLARIQPYRTLDDTADGVVLTFSDITQRVKAELAEHKARSLAEEIIDLVAHPLLVLNPDMTVFSASGAFYRQFDVNREQTMGRSLFEICDHGWDNAELRGLLQRLTNRHESFSDIAMTLTLPVVGARHYLLNGRPITASIGGNPLILLEIAELS